MSSTIPPSAKSHDDSSHAGTLKKRRVQRACDICRKRKIKCIGGVENLGESCVNCRVNKWACTFGDPFKNDNTSPSYVESLENRLQMTERLLKYLCPDDALLEELRKRINDNESIPLPEHTASRSQSTFTFKSSPANPSTKIAPNPLDDIGTLIRSRAAETGPESIMSTMAKSIRQVGRGGTAPHAHTKHTSQKHVDGVAKNAELNEGEVKQEEVEEEYDSEDDASRVLASTLKDLHLEPPEYRFFGKSSGAMLIRRAMEMKSEFVRNSSATSSPTAAGVASARGIPDLVLVGSVSPPSGIFSSTVSRQTPRRGALPPMMKNLRPEFWLPQPWERLMSNKQYKPSLLSILSTSSAPGFTSFTSTSPAPSQPPAQAHSRVGLDLDFPPLDLARSLIELYFSNMNLFMPLLHRPMFDSLVGQGGFLTPSNKSMNSGSDGGGTGFQFAHVYLLVCAVGSHFSDDPRCLLDASNVGEYSEQRSGAGVTTERAGTGLPYSEGWKWFDQVQMSNRSLIAPPTLYDLQVYALSAQFLQTSSVPQSAWTMCGIGIRLAQDVGAHRRGHNTDGQGPTKDGELWKKAFWVLVVMDRMISCNLGRSCAIQDEDFDLDPPIDCDDEFWDADNPDPLKRFKQPLKKPSLITHFLLYIELTHIWTFSLRTIYSINKSQVLGGLMGPNWEQAVVSELDSALNKWADSCPDYLKWDPHRENNLFFNQSAALWATHYHIQILVHRPFIPSPRIASSLKTPSSKTSLHSTMPSLAICTNAARACCHIVDVQQGRTGPVIAHVQMAVFQSALILLLSIWSGKRSGLLVDPSRQMADVRMCMQILKTSEKTWYALGRLNDLLSELASTSNIPLPASESQTPPTRNKRKREQDHIKSLKLSQVPSLDVQESGTRVPPLSPPTDTSDRALPSFAPSYRGTGGIVPEQTTHVLANYNTQPPSSDIFAANEQDLSTLSMSTASQSSRDQSVQYSDFSVPMPPNHTFVSGLPIAYAPILPAAVALPDMGYTRYAMPFTAISSNVPPVYNFEGYVTDAAAQRGPNTGPQPVIQGQQFVSPFDVHQLSPVLAPQNANGNSDPSIGYPGESLQDNESMDIWMNATSGIELEELGAYLTNFDVLTQNALGGSGMGWLGTNTEYEGYQS